MASRDARRALLSRALRGISAGKNSKNVALALNKSGGMHKEILYAVLASLARSFFRPQRAPRISEIGGYMARASALILPSWHGRRHALKLPALIGGRNRRVCLRLDRPMSVRARLVEAAIPRLAAPAALSAAVT